MDGDTHVYMYLNSLHVHYMQCCLGSTDMRKKLKFLVHIVVQHILNLDHIRDSPFKTSNANMYPKCESSICKPRPQTT